MWLGQCSRYQKKKFANERKTRVGAANICHVGPSLLSSQHYDSCLISINDVQKKELTKRKRSMFCFLYNTFGDLLEVSYIVSGYRIDPRLFGSIHVLDKKARIHLPAPISLCGVCVVEFTSHHFWSEYMMTVSGVTASIRSRINTINISPSS